MHDALITLDGKEICAYYQQERMLERFQWAKLASVKPAIMETTTVVDNSWKYDWKPSILENCGKIAVLLGQTYFDGRGQESDRIKLWW